MTPKVSEREPGEPERQDYEYERHGKATLFVSVEPLRTCIKTVSYS